MTEREDILEMLANCVRKNEKDRLEFCKNVGITLDDYYIKKCGDFEIEDMIRAFDNGRASLQNELTEKDKQIDYAKSIIKSLLDNSDEYARERAEQFLSEVEK